MRRGAPVVVVAILALAVATPALAEANASAADVAANVVRIMLDGGPSAAASCQLLVLADFVTQAVAHETLVPAPALPVAPAEFVIAEGAADANATCEQPVGSILLTSGAAAGWDEPGGISDAGWGVRPRVAEGLSPLTNDASIHIAGPGPGAAVACQTLIAFDAIVIAPGIAASPPVIDEVSPVATAGIGGSMAQARCEQTLGVLVIGSMSS